MSQKVSIIIPVYNAQKHIKKCLQSILCQSYSDLEILLIDDGSTDSSKQVILEMQKQDQRIVYYQKENSGPGEARNLGIDIANGTYLVFIDSDDEVQKEYIQTLVSKIEKTNSDIVISGIQQVLDNDINGKKIIIEDKEYARYILLGVLGKIYKTNYIKSNNIKFSKDMFAEDAYFNLQALFMTNQIVNDTYIGYLYKINQEGITKKQAKEQNKMQNYKVLDHLWEIMQQKISKETIQDKKDYIELYFFLYIGLGWLKLGKGLTYKEFSKQYDEIFAFYKKHEIHANKNSLLKFKNIKQGDFFSKLLVKVFCILDKIKLGKVMLYIVNHIPK